MTEYRRILLESTNDTINKIKTGKQLISNYDKKTKAKIMNWLKCPRALEEMKPLRDPITKSIVKPEVYGYIKDLFVWTDEDFYLIDKYNAPVCDELLQMTM